MPESWQRARSGYWPVGMPPHRDPVHGFPPTPGAPGPEYPSNTVSGLNGTSGEHPSGNAGQPLSHPGGGTDTLAAGYRMSSASATARPGPAKGPAKATWSTQWGGGPWVRSSVSSWGPDIMETAGIGGLAGLADGSQTWTYGEDDPTETWALHGPDDTPSPTFSFSDSDTATLPQTTTSDAMTPTAGAGTAPSGPMAGVSGAVAQAPGSVARISGSVAGPPGSVAAPGRRQAGHRGHPRPRRRRVGVSLLVTAAVLVTTAVAATAVYAVNRHGHAAAAPTATPPNTLLATPSPSPSPKLGRWQHIANRADDPLPLTLAELFPAQVTVKAGRRSYARMIERTNQSCRQAVFGSKLKAAVRDGCSQALRASYLSVNGKRMGTIGVLNLATAKAAARVGKVVGAPRQFIQPLPGLHGATKNLGKGTGVVWAVAKGHYLILMWAQYASLFRPSTSHDRKILMQFNNDLYEKTVNQSLTRRMVTGSPLTP